MRTILSSLTVLIVLLAVFWISSTEGYWFKDNVVVMDVGQGDAILITLGINTQILIDGGNGKHLSEKIGKYIPFWDMKIEHVILTHPHRDHYSGILWLESRYEVENLHLVDLCANPFSRIHDESIMRRGKNVAIGKSGRYLLYITYPHPSLIETNCLRDGNVNNASIVVTLEYDGRKYLFMGDAEQQQEESMVNEGILSDIYFLKAGHHCSKTSSSDDFLDIVMPEIAVCSAGKDNRYGHPHSEVLERFRARGIKYYVTSRDGDLVIKL